MAVSEMSFISMIGGMQQLDDLINICGETGAFQPDNVFSFYSSTENFSAISEENPYSQPFQTLKNAVYSCGEKLEETDIKGFHVNKAKINRYVNHISKSIENLVDEKRALYKELAFCKEETEKLKHFYGLNKSLKDVLSCEYIKARFGKIPISAYERFINIAEKSSENGVNLIFFTFTSDNKYRWGVYFTDPENENEIDRLFSSVYFEKIPIKPYDKNPYEKVIELQNFMKELYKKIENTDKKISEFWQSQKSQCMKFYTKLKELSTYFEIKSYAARYNDSFILVGWIPQENLKEFSEKISKIKGIEYSTEKGKNILSNMPPVKLKNKKIFEPFEFFVKMYGLPSYGESDPTPFVAITYALLFGIMFADLGQGLVVSLVGWLLWKIKKMQLGLVLVPCGIFSSVFGLIFGSVFGFENALDPLYKNLFGLHEKPIEVMQPQTTTMLIAAAVGLGAVLLVIAMIMGVRASIMRGHIGEAIFGHKGILVVISYAAVIFMALDLTALHTGIANMFFVILFIAIPLVLVMFSEILIKIFEKNKDWKPESWGEYIMQSFFELFEVILSLISNTMSFLRVSAFILVHAGLMGLFFKMAESASPAAGMIIIILGNVFVIALEAFLTAIQVMRLEFYEMFSKFFDGQGREFEPVRLDRLNS